METIQIGVRLSEDVVERIDAIAGRMQDETPGVTVTRSDVVRMLLLKALAKEPEKKKPRP